MFLYSARLVRVIDGDTVDLEIDLGFSIVVKDRFRLGGVDTPERGQKGYQEAKDFLIKTLTGVPLIAATEKAREKYGRYLAQLYLVQPGQAIPSEPSINAVMIGNGLARAYDGGKKDGGPSESASVH